MAYPLGVALILPALILGGCAKPPTQPVLYPNQHYQQTGGANAQAAVQTCERQARDFGLQPSSGSDVAGSAGRGAVVGGAAGAAWGLVRGDFGRATGAGAAAGAAGSAASAGMRGRRPSSTYQRFVEKCLVDSGYEVIGWQ
jgi:outer membrane lipoprotein SlyB